jgi:hypothetical protein
MSVLRSLESRIASLVEGTFSRAFKSEVRAVEIARKLAREMEEHKSTALSRTYVPNEYLVFLSPRDRQRFLDYEAQLSEELAGYLLEHARRERLVLMASPVVEFRTDDRLRLGEFGIQTGVVHPGDPHNAGDPHATADPDRDGRGETIIYGSVRPLDEPPEQPRRPRTPAPLLLLGGRRLIVGPAGVTIGRSRRCDVMVDDPNVSREHAEIRPRGSAWLLTDLGSTNGSRLNGRPLSGPEVIKSGDQIELGTTVLEFVLE